MKIKNVYVLRGEGNNERQEKGENIQRKRTI